jgi:hypothetical protein
MSDVNRSVPEVGYERIEMAGKEDFHAGNQSILPGVVVHQLSRTCYKFQVMNAKYLHWLWLKGTQDE